MQIFGRGGNNYLVNTEGMRQRFSGTQYSLTGNATIQADDGMKFSDSIAVHARKFDELPSLAENFAHSVNERSSRFRKSRRVQSESIPPRQEAVTARLGWQAGSKPNDTKPVDESHLEDGERVAGP